MACWGLRRVNSKTPNSVLICGWCAMLTSNPRYSLLAASTWPRCTQARARVRVWCMLMYKKKPHRLLNSGVSLGLDLEPRPCGLGLTPLERLGDVDNVYCFSCANPCNASNTGQLDNCSLTVIACIAYCGSTSRITVIPHCAYNIC